MTSVFCSMWFVPVFARHARQPGGILLLSFGATFIDQPVGLARLNFDQALCRALI